MAEWYKSDVHAEKRPEVGEVVVGDPQHLHGVGVAHEGEAATLAEEG
jgi:hypothetical protein